MVCVSHSACDEDNIFNRHKIGFYVNATRLEIMFYAHSEASLLLHAVSSTVLFCLLRATSG